MAVVEIARIQVRRGQENQTGVPQLAGGEFAWAADTEKLYIGLTREDGGSRDDNVEILTENHLRNFFSSLSPLSTTASYVYQVGENITLNPNATVNPFQVEFERTIQARLDDNDVSILNFGDAGTGENDDTQLIQYAHDNLFLNALGKSYDGNTSQDYPVVITARTLRLPTGIYKLQETVFITKGTHIKGEGIDKTIIKVTSGGHNAFQTCSFQSNKGLYAIQTGILAYVRFGDPEFASGNNDPDDIIIEDLTIEYDSSLNINEVYPLIGLHGSDNTVIRNVRFKGAYNIGDVTSQNLHCGIELKGTEMISCENVTVENCRFENIHYGILSNYDIRNLKIYKSIFNVCNRGIVFNENIDPLAQFGPRFANIVNNRFETIKREAIYAGSSNSNWSSGHITSKNQFIDVGNQGNAEGATLGLAVLKYETFENRSEDDYFNRFEFQLNNDNAVFNPLVEGAATLELIKGRYKPLAIGEPIKLCRIPVNGRSQQVNIDFNISNNRIGNLLINISNTNETSITEYYNTMLDEDLIIAWQVVTESNGFTVNITNNDTSSHELNYSVTLLT